MLKWFPTVILAAALALAAMTTADAKPRKHYPESGRPADCPAHRWCGCWLRKQFGIDDKQFNLAKHWLVLPRVHGPQVGSVAVMGRKGGGHVGIVTGTDGSGNPIVKSGNHNNAVGEGVYPKGRIIAYVQP